MITYFNVLKMIPILLLSHINDLLGRGKKRLYPAEMYHDEVLLISNLQNAEYFNKYFVNICLLR